jgi:hypothetical protein
VNLWASGFAASAAIQGLFPRAFARRTKWGDNDGWQREIAIWNVGTLAAILASRRWPADPDRAFAAGFAVLSSLFGANHLAAALESPRSVGNWLGAAANGAGLAVGLAALTSRAGRSASAPPSRR